MYGLLGLSVFAVLLTASAFDADNLPGGVPAPAEYGLEPCQVAVLRNGFSLPFVRPEVAGASTRLWMCADAGSGFLEIPSRQIQGFEQGPGVPAPAPVTPSGAPQTTASRLLPLRDPINNLIATAASRHRIDPDFVASVVNAESGFNPGAVSVKGAQGLMQLMPETAAWLGVDNVLDPAANIEGGTRYLRQLLDLYDGDAVKTLAAYNAGPQRVEQYGGIPPYPETRAYVARVIDEYNRKKLQQQAPAAK